MTWGPQLADLLAIAKASGFLPRALQNRPTLDEHLVFYFEAFQDLSRSRSYSQAGPQPLAMGEILAYCQMFDIEGYEFRKKLLALVQALDRTYREVVSEQAQQASALRDKA